MQFNTHAHIYDYRYLYLSVHHIISIVLILLYFS